MLTLHRLGETVRLESLLVVGACLALPEIDPWKIICTT
jgi:hypothetical protein